MFTPAELALRALAIASMSESLCDDLAIAEATHTPADEVDPFHPVARILVWTQALLERSTDLTPSLADHATVLHELSAQVAGALT